MAYSIFERRMSSLIPRPLSCFLLLAVMCDGKLDWSLGMSNACDGKLGESLGMSNACDGKLGKSPGMGTACDRSWTGAWE